MVARLVRDQEVMGSNPIASTIENQGRGNAAFSIIECHYGFQRHLSLNFCAIIVKLVSSGVGFDVPVAQPG